ncbi:hypothetical protein PO909_010683, partial [Leuciscus waleckii]
MCNSEWTHIHTHTDSMRRYEIAVLGHLYNLKYTHKKKPKAMYGTSTTPKNKTNKKLYTKGKHVSTACNAQNFNSIKSSWPKGTPNAIQEQRRSRSLILALPERNITQYFTLRATHKQTKTHRLRHTP